MENVESSLGDVVEIVTDNDVTRKEGAVRPIHPQTYRHEKLWLTIYRVDKVRNSLRDDLQNHEDTLLESLAVKRYQYGAWLMVVTSLLSGNFGAVDVDSVVEHRGKPRFFKEELSVAVLDGGRHGHLWI